MKNQLLRGWRKGDVSLEARTRDLAFLVGEQIFFALLSSDVSGILVK